MRLQDGFTVDKEKMFGILKFSSFRREKMKSNEDGTVSDEVKERVYDLKCQVQGCMIAVGIPAAVALKEFDYDTEVELVNPVVGTVANATFNGADVDWWVKADDIIPRGKPQAPAPRPHSEKQDNK